MKMAEPRTGNLPLVLLGLIIILLALLESSHVAEATQMRSKRQGAPLFMDWTAPRRGPSPMGANGPYGPFGVGMVGILQGVLFGGR